MLKVKNTISVSIGHSCTTMFRHITYFFIVNDNLKRSATKYQLRPTMVDIATDGLQARCATHLEPWKQIRHQRFSFMVIKGSEQETMMTKGI